MKYILCAILLSFATTLWSSQWVQVGSGEFNPKNTETTTSLGRYHQCGRIWQSAYTFDNAQNKTILWMGASHGGLWKSLVNSDGNITAWIPLIDNFPGNHTMGSFLIHPLDSNKILIGTGASWNKNSNIPTGLHRTTDQGGTWTNGNLLPVSVKQVRRLVSDRSDSTGNTVWVASDQGVWRSTDFGATWPQKMLKGDVTDLAQDAILDWKWYAGVAGKGVFIITKPSTQWDSCKIQTLSTSSRIFVAPSMSDTRYLYVLGVQPNGSLDGIFMLGSANSYNSCPLVGTPAWFTISTPNQNNDLNVANQGGHAAAIAVDPQNPDHVLIGLEYMAETWNGTSVTGVTWTKDDNNLRAGHFDQNHFLFRPSNGDIVISNDGGYYLYTPNPSTPANFAIDDDGNLLGINSFELSPSQTQGELAASYSDPDMFLAGLQDNGMAIGDAGANTLTYLGGGDGGESSFSPDDASELGFSTSGSGAKREFSTDSGATWDPQDNGLDTEGKPTVLIDPTPNRTAPKVFTYGIRNADTERDRVVYKLFSQPNDPWDVVSTIVPVKKTITHLDHTTNSNGHTLVMTLDDSKHVFRYTGTLGSMAFDKLKPTSQYGKGTPKVKVKSPYDTRINADRSPLQPDTLYYTTGSGRPSTARISTNNGATWTDVTGNMDTVKSPDLIKLIGNPHDLQHLYLATSSGVYISKDGGDTWVVFSEGLRANEYVQDIVFSDSATPTLYIATYGRGFYKRPAE